MNGRIPAFMAVFVVFISVFGRVTAEVSPATQPAASPPVYCGTIVRTARSSDGLVFQDTGDVIGSGASAPAVVRLPNGHLLAVLDLVMKSAGREPVLAVTQSADEGQHWSRPEPIRMVESKNSRVSGRHGVLAWMADGWLRLYFVSGANQGQGGGMEKRRSASSTQPANGTVIRSAITRDGLYYGLDRAVELAIEGVADPRLAIMGNDSQIMLLVGEASCPLAGRPADSRGMAHLVSPAGRRFEQVPQKLPAEAGLVGSVVRTKKGVRAYCSTREGIGSLISADGVQWKMEKGIRLADGCDPAVVQVADGTFVMLYCTLASGGPATLLADDGSGAAASGETEGVEPSGMAATSGSAAAWEPFAGESAAESGGGSGGGDSGSPGSSDSTGGPVAPELQPERIGDSTAEAGGHVQPGADHAGVNDLEGDLIPPKPDLINPVDYLDWFKQQYPNPTDVVDNAWGVYDMFMPGQSYPYQDDVPGWPGTIDDMFNGEYNGPIVPWDPQEHPGWEATHSSIGGLLDQFREATRYEQYACPLFEPVDANDGPPLVRLLLPSLASHRAMTKATMADAWRAENGVVQPDLMADAMETCLRNASHMEQGHTLINHLVGIAEQNLVESNALKALEHNVFSSPEQLEAALNTLRQYDSYDTAAGASNWMPLEHAAALDSVQWMYPPGPDGQPALNRERARNYLSAYSARSSSDDAQSAAMNEKLDRLAALSPEEVRQAVDVLDTHFRELDEKWRTGYPQVRLEEIDQLAIKNSQTNALTEQIVPSLARAYNLIARNEATRRATQLTYEVHLFKARNGYWPASLDELGVPTGDRTRTDPFTGGDFGYRLGESGPTIYTLSENGRDDGGVHSENWASNDDPNASDDYVFWPPQK